MILGLLCKVRKVGFMRHRVEASWERVAFARLKDAGYCNERGQPFNPQSVRAMIEGPQPLQHH
jgi:hypothetical protein